MFLAFAISHHSHCILPNGLGIRILDSLLTFLLALYRLSSQSQTLAHLLVLNPVGLYPSFVDIYPAEPLIRD